MKPICIDLFCGLGGWADGFLAEGYEVIGFDIERHDYGTGGYPGQLVIQDVHTIHGSQFRNAACIVASPPCQSYSYAAQPWKRAKAQVPDLKPEWWKKPQGRMNMEERAEWELWKAEHPADPPNTALFDACFRIQREASEAAGRHIPLVVENVKGAQPWVGRAQANYGSFYLWGDVRSVGGRIIAAHRVEFGAPAVRAKRQEKNGHLGGGSWFAIGSPGQTSTGKNPDGRKVAMNFHEHEKTGKPGRSFQSAAVDGLKLCAQTRGLPNFSKGDARRVSGAGVNRKAASAQIAKIPFELAVYIARCFKPVNERIVNGDTPIDAARLLSSPRPSAPNTRPLDAP